MRLFFFPFFLLLFSSSAFAEPLRVGVVHFPPHSIVEGRSVVGGTMIKTMEKTLKNASLDYQLIPYPAKIVFASLGAGDLDLLGGLKTNIDYHDNVIFSENTIGSIELRLYGFGNAVPPTSLAELKGTRLGIIRGFNYNGKLTTLTTPENKKFVTIIDSHSSALRMLASNRIDFLLDYESTVNTELKLHPLEGLVHTTLEKLDLYFVLNKNIPHSSAIMALLDASYSSLFPYHATQNVEMSDDRTK